MSDCFDNLVIQLKEPYDGVPKNLSYVPAVLTMRGGGGGGSQCGCESYQLSKQSFISAIINKVTKIH